MVDFDSTIFPLLDAIGDHPHGAGVAYPTMATWAGLADACGGAERLAAILEEVMAFDWMQRFAPFEGAIAVLASLRERGIAICVVSDRPMRRRDDLQAYFKHWTIPVDEIVCEPGIDKVSWCRARGVEVLVDDHPDTLMQAHKAGLTALGLHFPYNEEVFRQCGLPAAASWAELERLLVEAIDA
jgi:FMN phosphatase YigB (HAD superfamily)